MASSPSLFSETFGHKSHQAIILNAGAGCQAIAWPDQFCQALSEKGYFVIRYDYRDTGLSPATDYEKHPYTIMDLAQDVVQLLKKYHIKQATCAGYSMGGQVCQFLGAYFPHYVKNLVLMGTSTDFKPGFDGLEGRPHTERLSPPNAEYVAFCQQKVDTSHFTLEQKIDYYVAFHRWIDGNSEKFEEPFFREQARLSYTRAPTSTPYISHAQAMKASFDDHKRAHAHITAPTLIIHGGKDPVFPLDHPHDLHQKIKGSELIIWDDFAHTLSPKDFDRVMDAIDGFIKRKRK